MKSQRAELALLALTAVAALAGLVLLVRSVIITPIPRPTVTPAPTVLPTPKPAIAERCGGDMAYGQTKFNRLPAGGRCEYPFRAAAGDLVTIRLNRVDVDFDPWLELLDNRGVRLAFDDDGGGWRNSRIQSWTAPTSGTYTIRAAAYNNRSDGRFELRLERGEPPKPLPGSGPRLDTLRQPDDRQVYAFTAAAAEVVTILMERAGESSLDPYLELRDPAGVTVKTDDDSGGYPNAMILEHRLASGGTYTIIAGSQGGATSGSFYLTLWR